MSESREYFTRSEQFGDVHISEEVLEMLAGAAALEVEGVTGLAGGKVSEQIWGRKKCFDTKKAERYFKERRIKYQLIDLDRFGISRGELQSVKNAVGLDALVDERHPDAALITYLARPEDKLERIFEDPTLLKTPIVRNGKKATSGYRPEVWKDWE